MHESRALAMQPRTLEVLRGLGIAETLIERGNDAVQLRIHSGERIVSMPLFDIGLEDTAFPFLLFISQAETEAILNEHLAARGLPVEHGVELVSFSAGSEGVACTLRSAEGGTEEVRCRPTTEQAAEREPETEPLTLAELQRICGRFTGGTLRLRDPAWLTYFRVHHRQAAHYRSGRVFVAGDAAHVHSPAGAQGMNTGIQDAWNLGWKLALVARGVADPALLDTYESERLPVGHFVLRFTDRASAVATSDSRFVRLMRTKIVPRLLPLLLRIRKGRAFVFRTLSQLAIHYRNSPAVDEGPRAPHAGPRAGDRLPDGRILRGGRETWLHEALAAPAFHLLLCGPPDGWPDDRLATMRERYGALLTVHRLTRDAQAAPGILLDPSGEALARLGVEEPAQYLVRPDGHIGYRSGGTDTRGAERYLARWLGTPG